MQAIYQESELTGVARAYIRLAEEFTARGDALRMRAFGVPDVERRQELRGEALAYETAAIELRHHAASLDQQIGKYAAVAKARAEHDARRYSGHLDGGAGDSLSYGRSIGWYAVYRAVVAIEQGGNGASRREGSREETEPALVA